MEVESEVAGYAEGLVTVSTVGGKVTGSDAEGPVTVPEGTGAAGAV